jgi:RHS repeat-associated protein
VTDTYDAHGNVTQRVWKNGSGQTNRSQTLIWDGRGRLWKVVERDAQTNGFNWSAVYDAIGRRLRTTIVTVTNSVTNSAFAVAIAQYYDPMVEFLELGVSINGQTTWKLYGPDLSGRYGGMQGVGGFEAIAPPPDLFCPMLSDLRGNQHAVYDQRHLTIMFFPSRVTGYGAVPGHRPPPLGFGADIASGSAWRGRWSDVSGLTSLGARHYDPEAGRFLSADPLGRLADPSLYTFANGDPVNFFDPDGRLGRAAFGIAGIVGQTLVGTAVDIARLPFLLVGGAGDLARRIPVVGTTLGGSLQLASALGQFSLGIVSEAGNAPFQLVSGIGNTAVGALSFNQETLSYGLRTIGTGFMGIADVAGKAWAAPNTGIGLALGIAGLPFGAQPTFGNNAVQFENHPIMSGDITIGNTIAYSSEMGPNVPDPQNPGYTYGQHEIQHTYQAMITGPLYLPLNGIGGFISIIQAPPGYWDPWHYNNFMERGPGSSPPRMW